mmetsp:Transcript_93423/g.145845  ORF Transcript_93423/g.145845 Transcript_93423/m.145845 type:complete len:397 (+) Transcript_93423:43-1233(+)
MLHLCRFFLCCWVCNPCFFADASAAGDLSIVMSNQQVAVCTIAAGNGIDALFDSGIKIFQSVRQCNYIDDDPSRQNRVACLTDIGDVIASIANLAQYVINIISSCTGHHVPHSRCIQYGFALAGDISKLAASAGEIDLNCIHVPDNYKNTIECLFDIKFGVHEILQVVEHSLVLKDACETGPKFCAGGVFDVVASLGTLANYVLAGLGNCQAHTPFKVGCGESISKLIAAVSGITSAAISASEFCKPQPAGASGSAQAVSTTPSIGADFMTWAKHEISKGATPEELKANVSSAIQQELSQVSALFASRDTRKKRRFIPEAENMSKFNFNYLLAGATPVALLMGYLMGRRAMPSRRDTTTFLKVQHAPPEAVTAGEVTDVDGSGDGDAFAENDAAWE